MSLRDCGEGHNGSRRIEMVARQLKDAELSISPSDRFVIGAAQTLVAHSTNALSYDEIKTNLEAIRRFSGPQTKDVVAV